MKLFLAYSGTPESDPKPPVNRKGVTSLGQSDGHLFIVGGGPALTVPLALISSFSVTLDAARPDDPPPPPPGM